MRILLLTSPLPYKYIGLYREEKMHIGILYIIGMLEKEGHKVNFVDLYLNNYNIPNIMKYDFVGIHTTSISMIEIKNMLRTIKLFRKKGWKGKIMVGGPHASLAPQSFPDYVDYIIQGEGEYAVKDLVIGNVKKRIIRYPRIEDLDSLPRPAYHHYKEFPYTKWDEKMLEVRPIANMNTSRGCPFSCIFCGISKIWGKKYTYQSAERIIDDIKYLKKDYNVEGIFFREDNFTLNIKRVIDLCALMIKENIGIKWICETRVDFISKELLKLMNKSGCRGIYVGVEAATQKLLNFLNKKITIDQVKKVAQWCHETGIKIYTSFLTGFPNENIKDKIALVELIKEIKPYSFKINKYKAYPGSKLYDYMLKKKLYKKISPEGILDINE